MFASWKDWCRLCADKTATMNLESVEVINKIIFPVTQISLNEENGATLSVCEKCYTFAHKLERFRERCEHTNRMFMYLFNYNDKEMCPQELENIRGRYLDISALRYVSELSEKVLDDEGQDLLELIPMHEIVGNEENAKTEDAGGQQQQQQLFFKVESFQTSAGQSDEEPTASDSEQWEPKEIEYEDDRLACYSDPASCDEKLVEVDCMAGVDHTPPDDDSKNSGENPDTPTKLRKRGQSGRSSASKRQSVLQCDICLKTFSSNSYLKKHEATHLPDGEKQLFACNFCDKMFSKAISVKLHIRCVHDGEKPFICEECGKAFSSKGALKEHYIVHTEERPFQCSRCPKRFKNAARLKTHEDIHNDTLYVCPHCGLQLNTKRTLNMHMVVHSDQKKYKCQYCGNEYKRSKALKAHLILHTGLRPYLCPFCDRTFANGSNCRSHKKKFHPNELAALEAAGGQNPATNIPKLENLQPKSQNAKQDPESSEEVFLVEVENTRQNNIAKVKTSSRPQKKAAHRITVAKRIKVTG